jgi:hypothetical protein
VPSASSPERPKSTSTNAPTTWPSRSGFKPDSAYLSRGETCRSTQECSGHGTRWDGCTDASIHGGRPRSRCSNMAEQEQHQHQLSSNDSSALRSRHGTTPYGYHGANGPSNRRRVLDCIKVPSSAACGQHTVIARMPLHRLLLNLPRSFIDSRMDRMAEYHRFMHQLMYGSL